MEALVGGAILGVGAGLIGGLAVLVFTLLQKPKSCSKCGTPAPKIRKSPNRRQVLWGGWTCPKCFCELDRHGREVVEWDN